MNIDPNVLSWRDWLLVGVIIGQYLNARSRRFMGERLGRVEDLVARLLGPPERKDKP